MNRYQMIEEIAFLAFLIKEMDSMEYGEGPQINMPALSRTIKERIVKLKKLTK